MDSLNAHLDEVASISDEDMDRVKEFINLFMKCETVYKTLYPEMKRLKDGEKVDVRQLKFNVQWFEAALRYFGIEHEHQKMNVMFYYKDSYLICRDNIIHGQKIQKVLNSYDEMIGNMTELLNNVANGHPE